MNRKWTTVLMGSMLLVLASCTQSTSPRRDDTTCKSGISISSGDKCGDQ